MEQNIFLLIDYKSIQYLCQIIVVKANNNSNKIESLKSIRMSPESIKITFSPELIDRFTRFFRMKFKGIYLKQDSASFLHKNIVNLYITYKLDTWSKDLNTDFTLGDSLFGAVKLTKNADPGKCKYSSYGIRFDSHS